MLELAVLAVVCMLPFWPRISFYVAPQPSPAIAAVEPMPIIEREPVPPLLPMHSIDLMPSSRNLADPVGDASFPAKDSPAEASNRFLLSSRQRSTLATRPGVEPTGGRRIRRRRGSRRSLALLGRGRGLALLASRAGRRFTASTIVADPLRRSPQAATTGKPSRCHGRGARRFSADDRFAAKLAKSSPPHTLRAVLLHEWAHIRHRDLWLLALGRCLLVVLFAHPLFWWLRRTIRSDQELLADAVAAGTTGTITPKSSSAWFA